MIIIKFFSSEKKKINLVYKLPTVGRHLQENEAILAIMEYCDNYNNLFYCLLPTKVYLMNCVRTSHQDGSVGRHGSHPPTTSKLRNMEQLSLTAITQINHHSEIELNGNLTTMELKESHPSRLVEGQRCRMSWSHNHVW